MIDLHLNEIANIQSYQFEFTGKSCVLTEQVSGFSTDSRTIKPGDIFVALKGEKFDGHQFIPELRARGIETFIVSRVWFDAQDQQIQRGNYFIVQDPLVALQEISHYYRLKRDLPVLALTGSNGKTTTKEMIAAVLSEKYQVLKNRGNLNNHIGVPLSLLELTVAHEIAILEMGTNHFGEIARLAELAKPTCGLITNIGPAHLEFFGSLAGVFKAKSELWEFLARHGHLAFLNVDDTWLRKQPPAVEKLVTYGFEKAAQIQGQFISLDKLGRPNFRVNGTEIQLKVTGRHNIHNALAAVAVGLEFGLSMDPIKRALGNFLATSKRMELIHTRDGVIINDCYNSNPESAKKALVTLSQMHTNGRRIAVLADMLELGKRSEIEHRAMGDFVTSLLNIDHLFTYGPISRLTTEQAQKSGLKNTIHFEEKEELINHLKKVIAEDDLILIKGSRGMQMEEVTMEIAKA